MPCEMFVQAGPVHAKGKGKRVFLQRDTDNHHAREIIKRPNMFCVVRKHPIQTGKIDEIQARKQQAANPDFSGQIEVLSPTQPHTVEDYDHHRQFMNEHAARHVY